MSKRIDARKKVVRWSGMTDVGRFRKENQDAFLALAVDRENVYRLGKLGEGTMKECDYVFAVSDGMGGANAGDFASRITVDKITRLFPQTFRAAADGMEVGFQEILTELLDLIHAELIVLGRSYDELSGMGATLSLCWVRPKSIYFAHVGDSRIYRLQAESSLDQISHDHTHVGWLQRRGELTEMQARNHPQRNCLQEVMGGKNQNLNPQFGAITHEPGDRYLICSDGVVEGLFNSGLERLLRHPKDSKVDHLTPAERIVREAVATDGRDNTTAVVFELV
ncbi:MAG: protein phosphatase 2C domain-containing protein [Verrucomicrobiota bacterium]